MATDLPAEGSFTVNRYNWILPTKITFPGGANQSQQYDAFGQITGIQSKDPAQNPLMDLSYTYDKVGNTLSKTGKEGATSYTYDDRYRLTGVDAPGTINDEAYTYDPVGNRLTAHNTTGNWQYNHNNQLLAYENHSFTYDDNGNTTTETDTSTSTLLNTYVYNQQDRLIEVQDVSAAVIASYDYDPLGRRIKKTTSGVTTWYLYNDDGLIAEFDATGNEIQSYGYMPNSPWGTNPLYTKTASGYAYYHNDHLGTPQLLTANSGAKVWEGKMSAFGQMNIATESITNNLRFPGQYYDQETGKHYNYFRNYHPGIGRYTSSDSIGVFREYTEPQFLLFIEEGVIEVTDFAAEELNHLYGYVGEDPVNWFDPYGLAKSKKPDGYEPSGGSEHKTNKTPSNKSKHEKGDAKKDKSRGREKGDRQRGAPRKRPRKHTGPWPPEEDEKKRSKNKPKTPKTPKLPGTGIWDFIPNPCLYDPKICNPSWPYEPVEAVLMPTTDISKEYCG